MVDKSQISADESAYEWKLADQFWKSSDKKSFGYVYRPSSWNFLKIPTTLEWKTTKAQERYRDFKFLINTRFCTDEKQATVDSALTYFPRETLLLRVRIWTDFVLSVEWSFQMCGNNFIYIDECGVVQNNQLFKACIKTIFEYIWFKFFRTWRNNRKRELIRTGAFL